MQQHPRSVDDTASDRRRIANQFRAHGQKRCVHHEQMRLELPRLQRIDRRKLGLGVMAFVQIMCTQHTEEVTAEFERIVRASPNVMACDNTTGEADYLLQIVAADLDDYSQFVEKVLRKLPGVLGIRSNLSLRQVKATNRLPIR
jgi:hypothetical protein